MSFWTNWAKKNDNSKELCKAELEKVIEEKENLEKQIAEMILSRNFPEEDSSSVQESVLNRMINDCDQIIYQLNEKIYNLKDENF